MNLSELHNIYPDSFFNGQYLIDKDNLDVYLESEDKQSVYQYCGGTYFLITNDGTLEGDRDFKVEGIIPNEAQTALSQMWDAYFE